MKACPWISHGATLICRAPLSRSVVGKAPVHPVLQGKTNWEAMQRAAGQGEVPHTPSPRGGGGNQPQYPQHPTTHTFPMALPPGTHMPRTQRHLLGPPHLPCQHPWVPRGGCTPRRTRVHMGGKGGGGPEQLLMPMVGVKDLSPPHTTWPRLSLAPHLTTRCSPAPVSGRGNAPPLPCQG